MNGLKRLALIVFGLAGILCLAALALPWMGPFQRDATLLMDNELYYLVLQALLAVTALGVLIALLRGLFTPRQRKSVVITKSGHDQISVSTKAISSQATHVIEADNRFVAEKVRVSAKGRGGVRVDVRVRPRHTVDLTREGSDLHDRLAAGLSTICGDKVGRVNLQFVEAENPIPAQDVLVEPVPNEETYAVPASAYEHAAQLEGEAAGESGYFAPEGKDDVSALDVASSGAEESEVA